MSQHSLTPLEIALKRGYLRLTMSEEDLSDHMIIVNNQMSDGGDFSFYS